MPCCAVLCWPEVLVSAYDYANILALVNDPVADVPALISPFTTAPPEPGEAQKNCSMVDFLFMGWPFPFLYTTREVQREDMK